VSGFDFDALRDPEAPIPGSRERTGVNARARQLRARQLRNRAAIGTTAFMIVAGAVLGVVAAQRQNEPQILVPGPSTTVLTTPTTAGPSNGDRFIPPTSMENGKVVLPVTQPDGATFTVRYPPKMHIAELGFADGIIVDWPVNATQCCDEFADISYTSIHRVYGDAKPIAVYPGADGEDVGLYDIPFPGRIGPQGPHATRQLAFQFGPWLVRIDDAESDASGIAPVAMNEEHLATWARSLTGTVDANGYLVLHAAAPLSLGNKFSGGFGSEPIGMNYSATDTLAFDSHEVCGHPPSAVSMDQIATPFLSGTLARGNVQWCVNKVLHVQATGSAKFLTAALQDLEVSPLRSPSAAPTITTTSTTAPRVTSSDSAESSSFVSPQHGWVLGKSGQIDRTTDGGATWRRVGTVAIQSDGAKIRFIGPSDGFAYGSIEGAPSVLITHDAGATWTKLNTPFGEILDFAIAHGIVYVVAGRPYSTGLFIWSTPVAHLVWKRAPLTLQLGAGPIPAEQIVLAGGKGWIINEDRTVISGARISPPGEWTPWNPPCRTLNGPAYLAASTSTDLVAVCSEHDYGGGPVTSGIYFSRDGGLSFTRHDAPGYGPITSPSPSTAIVSTDSGLQRTTDDGATWHSVFATTTGNGVSDIGFTTATQGFAIFHNGLMLMTYNAGATWQKANLP
jgi:hypothetical protein